MGMHKVLVPCGEHFRAQISQELSDMDREKVETETFV